MSDSGYWERILGRREKVAYLTKQGLSAADIGAILGITDRSVTRHRVALGISQTPPTPLTDAELRRAADLVEDGCSRNEVARTLGRSPHTIARHFPGHGWPPGLGARLAQHQRWADYRIKAMSA